MHDIDRTTMEYGQDTSGFDNEFEFGDQDEWESESDQSGQLSDEEEMEMAQDLLNVSNEQELEQFLGKLVRKVGSIAGKVIRSPVGKAVGGVLKGVAKKALPLAGGAIGGYIGGPLGAKIGKGLASAASGAMGLEAESGGEDLEFEGARQFVRLAADTVNRAARAGGGDPRAIAQKAATSAARQFAPGLLGRGAAGRVAGQLGARNSGRWSRQGNKIVIYGA